MAGTGQEQPSTSPEKPPITPGCSADCSAVSDKSLDLLARAVLLVAGMAIPEHERAAVLARVVATMSPARKGSEHSC